MNLMIKGTILPDGKKVYIGNKSKRKCRFCGRTDAETTFRKIAHAFPECMGNHTLISHQECDACNEFFGSKLEDSFAKRFQTEHLFCRIKGKERIPAYKFPDKSMKFEQIQATINGVKEPALLCNKYDGTGTDFFDGLSSNASRTIQFPLHPYIPIAVYKCFVKMALSIIPEAEMDKFSDTILWLMEESHSSFYSNGRKLWLAIQYFNPQPNPRITYALFQNNDDKCLNPYLIFIVDWANISCIAEVPTNKNSNRLDIRDYAKQNKLLENLRFENLSTTTVVGKSNEMTEELTNGNTQSNELERPEIPQD